MMRGGLLGLIDGLQELHARGETGVLGIVVGTTGSTYRKAGALVLLDRIGMRHGAVSGGCLEPEIEAKARAVLTTERAACLDIDTRTDEDLLFGSGTGCRGKIRLLLLPQPPGAPLSRALAMLSRSFEPLRLELWVSGAHTGSGCTEVAGIRLAWRSDGTVAAEPAAGAAEKITLPVQSPPRVLLFGAGPETDSLYAFLRRLGWRTSVIEHRGRWLAYARDAGIEHSIEHPPETAALVWAAEPADAGIIMTHNFTLDAAHLKYCAASSLPYIGLLGPPARRDQLLAEVGQAVAERLQSRLHAPVGLPLGGSGPEAVSLAIVAELQRELALAGRLH
jgi:xanthine dehydrogenase accessory factor